MSSEEGEGRSSPRTHPSLHNGAPSQVQILLLAFVDEAQQTGRLLLRREAWFEVEQVEERRVEGRRGKGSFWKQRQGQRG